MKNLLGSLLLSSCNALSPTGDEECLSKSDSDHLSTTLTSLGHDWSRLASLFTQGVNDANLRLVTEALNQIDDQVESINLNLVNKNCIDGDSEALVNSSKQIFNTLQSNLDVFFAPLTKFDRQNVAFESSNLTVQLNSPISPESNRLIPSSVIPPTEQSQQGIISKINAKMQVFQSIGKRASELLRRATRNKDGNAEGDVNSRIEGESSDGEDGEHHNQGGKLSEYETHEAMDENSRSEASHIPPPGGQFAYTAIQPQFGQVETDLPQYGNPQYGEPQYGQPQYNQPQYGQSQYGTPQYGTPQYGTPQYGTPQYGHPQYVQPQYGQPPYGQPQYGQHQYGQPQYGQPSYGQPQYGQPQYLQPWARQPEQTEQPQQPPPDQPYAQYGSHDVSQPAPPQEPPTNSYHASQPSENSEESIKKLSEKTVKVVLDQLNVISSVFTKSNYQKSGTLIHETQHRVLEFANRLRFNY